MALEPSVTNIADLNAAWPSAADPKSNGDDHIRNLKTALKNDFAGFTGAVIVTGTDGGAINAYTLTPAQPLPAYGTKMIAVFAPISGNTGEATLNISGLGVKALTSVDGAPLVSGDIEFGTIYSAYYDGTKFRLLSVTKNYVDQKAFSSALPAQPGGVTPAVLRSIGGVASFGEPGIKGTDIASAATINLTTASGDLVHVTGTTTITAITIPVGAERTVIFDGALTLTHGAALLLPGAQNITTAANDRMIVRGDTAGAVVVAYIPASGKPVVSPVPRMLVVLASQPWVVPATEFEVELQAAGGGGGKGGTRGGGSGGYVKKRFSGATIGATAMITLGAKGVGSTTPATNAQDSTFVLAGFTSLTAGGGGAGGGGAIGASQGGNPGTAVGGDLNIPGQRGLQGGTDTTAAHTLGAPGGESMFGRSNVDEYGPGPAVSGYGAGGASGGQVYPGPTFHNGADGGAAICIIRW